MHRSNSASRIRSVAFGVIAALAGKAFSATFTNSTAIVIPGPGSSSGSEISVSGLGNSITFPGGPITIPSGVSVTITGFIDTQAEDVGLVLVGPTGAALVLMGDCGGSTPEPINLVFDDRASSSLPQTALNFSGTFRPTQYASVGSLPSPGPGISYKSPAPFGTSTFGGTFAFTNPNGNWSLYAMDPVSGDRGEISNGWSLQITAVPEPASLPLVVVGAASLTCRRRR